MPRHIDPSALLNVPMRMLQGCVWSESQSRVTPVELPAEIYVGPFASIGIGAQLGEQVIVDAYCTIDPKASIGARTVLIYRATVGGGAKIGPDSIIGGFVAENCVVGARCRMMGFLIHTHANPEMSWDHHEVPEISPVLEDDVFVGFGAKIIGPVRLASRCYVAAGAIVTRDVPSFHVAFGVNELVHKDQWSGSLKDSPFLSESPQ